MDDLHNFFYPYYAWDGDGAPYFAMSEKSAGATRRTCETTTVIETARLFLTGVFFPTELEGEREATDKFDAIRQRLEHSLVNNAVRVIQLGANDNKSPWSMLPETTLQLCLQFFKPKGFDDYKYGSPILVSKRKLMVAEEASAAPAEEDKETTASLPSEEQGDVATGENATAASEKKESFDINALYTPGYKEMIPLLTPDHHLTGALFLEALPRQFWKLCKTLTTVVSFL